MAVKALFRSEDIPAVEAATGRKYELIRGELYEIVPPTIRHAQTIARIAQLLMNWNDKAKAGNIIGDAGFTLARGPDTVRAPDAGFIAKGRVTREQARRGFAELAPDIAFEVKSPNNTWRYLRQKADHFFEAGCKMVVIVDPDRRAEVHQPGVPSRLLGLDDVFEAADILPGFSCRVRDFFPEEL